MSAPSFKERISFFISTAYNYIRGRQHHHEIAPGIFLGMLPLRSIAGRKVKHDDKIINECSKSGKPLGLVVAAVQDFELDDAENRFFKPVSPRKWRKRNQDIKFTQVRIPDFSTKIDHDELYNAVHDMEQTQKAGQSIYVHCKAGRSRSVIVLVCYLMTAYEDPTKKRALTYEEAVNLIRGKRSFISLKDDKKYQHKKKAIMEFVEFYNQPAQKEQRKAEQLTSYYNHPKPHIKWQLEDKKTISTPIATPKSQRRR